MDLNKIIHKTRDTLPIGASSTSSNSNIQHAADGVAVVRSHPVKKNEIAFTQLASASHLSAQNKAWEKIQKDWPVLGNKRDVDLNVLEKLVSCLPNLCNNPTTQKAVFSQVHTMLDLSAFQNKPERIVPILSHLAECISAIKNVEQHEQAFKLIENGLALLHQHPKHQMTILNSLTKKTWQLDKIEKQRAFAILEQTMQQTSGQPKLHLPVLLTLTDIMQWSDCRERAYQLVQQGMARLEGDEVSQARLNIGLGLAASKSAR